VRVLLSYEFAGLGERGPAPRRLFADGPEGTVGV